MNGRVLIVEDEPIVAMDLQQEIEQFGCEVAGLAESADEALMAVEEDRPDIALMDIRIVGSMDGIQTARLLRHAYHLPVVFLTSYSDETTLARAKREMPYGYLTKPFQSRDLKATLSMALHKAMKDAAERAEQSTMAATLNGIREGILTVSMDHMVQFMNGAAEEMAGWNFVRARGMHLLEVLHLRDREGAEMPLPAEGSGTTIDEFGWTLSRIEAEPLMIDLSMAPMYDDTGKCRGYVVTLRDAALRQQSALLAELRQEAQSFDLAPTGMVQLDSEGKVVRVNQALVKASGVTAESLIGQTLTALKMDPDPRIAKGLMHMLLRGEATAGVSPPPMN